MQITTPLMPRATALWLIRNTKLSFKQIADFCGLHVLEVQNLADEESLGLVPFDPIASGQITSNDIKRAEEDPKCVLSINKVIETDKKANLKKAKYVPISRRSDRPNAIAWLVKNYPEVPDKAIISLLGTTQNMVKSIRDKTYWNMHSLKPQNPVGLYLCAQKELDALIEKYS